MSAPAIHYLDMLPAGLRLAYCLIPEDDTASRRERETAAVRSLLDALLGSDALISHNENGAPYIAGHPEVSLSITHSRRIAAVAISTMPDRIIGIDAEEWRSQLVRVAPRVLSAEEMEEYSASEERLLAAWTMKEALFKAALAPGTDFARDIKLPIPFKNYVAAVNGSPVTIIYSAPLPEFPETLLTVALREK